MELKIGDKVSCKFKEANLTLADAKDYDQIETLQIIGNKRDEDFYLYVPHYILIKPTIKLDRYSIKNFNINEKYIGDEILTIQQSNIYKIQYSADGMECLNCKEYCEYAQCNSYYGKFICWSCRQNPYR